MKYSIEGVEDGIVIGSVKKNNKGQTLTVSYLDGTKDVVDFNEENMKKIVEIMEKQAKRYVESSETKVDELEKTNKIVKITGLTAAIVFFLFALFLVFDISRAALFCFFSVLTSGTAVLVSKDITKKTEDIKKYKMFLNETIAVLPKYHKIVEKEFKISKSSNPVSLFDISCLDKCTIEQLNQIKSKVERYSAIEPKIEDFSVFNQDEELGHQKTLKKINKSNR